MRAGATSGDAVGGGACDGRRRLRGRPGAGARLAALAPGLDLGVDVAGGRDDGRAAGELAARLDDPRVEVLHHPAYAVGGGLAVEQAVELGVLLAQPDRRGRDAGDLLALDEPLHPPVRVVLVGQLAAACRRRAGRRTRRAPWPAAPAGPPSGSGCGSAPRPPTGRCARRARPRAVSGRCAEVRTRTRRADGTWSPPRWSVAPVYESPRTTRPLGQGPISTPAVVAEVVPPGPVAVTVQVIVAPTSPAASVSLFVVWPTTVVPLRCQA